MKTVAFVPARCGSKSIPLKNIKSFCGYPLIYWALKALSEVHDIDEIYVATDCDEIRETVEAFNYEKVGVYMRDPENARDESSTESVVLEFLNKKQLASDDVFILAQATCPLVRERDYREALEQYRQEAVDSLLTCARMKVFLWDKSGKPLNYDFRQRPRRQEIQGELVENGAFYITSIAALRESGNRLSGNISVYEMPEYSAVDIDDDDDWTIAEILMKKYILSN
jgi:N-acylneuraminate cytidylyltransferase